MFIELRRITPNFAEFYRTIERTSCRGRSGTALFSSIILDNSSSSSRQMRISPEGL
jgi:hypothetical protein